MNLVYCEIRVKPLLIKYKYTSRMVITNLTLQEREPHNYRTKKNEKYDH